MNNAQDNAAHTCSYSCDRPECIKAQRDELAAAAVQEAVCWQRKYISATRGNRPVEWHTITKDEFEATKAGKWADRYEVRALYAAPVTAAPADTWFADQLTAMGEVIPLDSTPAAPGIDLAEVPRYVLSHTDDVSEMRESERGAWVRLRDVEDVLAAASPKATTFRNYGDSEAQLIADEAHLNCPACGGSGHVEDSPKGGSEARQPSAWISDNDLLKLRDSIDEARNIRMSSERTHLRVHPVFIPAMQAGAAGVQP